MPAFIALVVVLLVFFVIPVLYRTARDSSKNNSFAREIAAGWQCLAAGDIEGAKNHLSESYPRGLEMIGHLKEKSFAGDRRVEVMVDEWWSRATEAQEELRNAIAAAEDERREDP